jgi:hypothetical protein
MTRQVEPAGTGWRLEFPPGQRTVIPTGGEPAGYPKKQAAEDWL